MRVAFTITLFEGLVVATLRLKFLKETVRGDGSSISLRNFPSILKNSYMSILDSLKWMPKSLRYVVILEILESFFVSLAAPFWILYAKDVIGLTPLDWGTLMLISGICGLVLSLPIGYLVDRYGSRPLMLLSLSLAPICTLLFIFSSSFWSVAAAFILLAFVNTAVSPSFSTIIANIIPRERRGRLYALLGERGINISTGRFFGGGFLLFVPAAIGSLFGGYLYDMKSGFPFIVLIAALVGCLFIAYRFVKEPEQAAM